MILNDIFILDMSIIPVVGGIIGEIFKAVVPSLLGSLFGSEAGEEAASGYNPQMVNMEQIKGYMAPTRNLVGEQLGLSRQLMDPGSSVNLSMRNLLSQNAQQQGQNVASNIGKLSAMRGISPGQASMQMNTATNNAMGGVNNAWRNMMQERYGQGLGIMGNMTNVSKGLDENVANAYVSNINSANQAMAAQTEAQVSGALGGMQLGNSMFGNMDLGGNESWYNPFSWGTGSNFFGAG